MKNVILAILLVPGLCFAENLFKNGDMDTSSGWKGSRKFVKLDTSRVIVLKANKRKSVSFNQSIECRDIKDLVMKYRYKSFNYKGRGMQLRGIRGDGSSTFSTRKLKADGKWHEGSWKFTEIKGSRSMDFSITLLEGEGEVYFDDISIEGEKAE